MGECQPLTLPGNYRRPCQQIVTKVQILNYFQSCAVAKVWYLCLFVTSRLKLFGDYVYLPNTNSFAGSNTEGVPRHYKVTRSSLELPTMIADGRVRRGRGLSFDASPPDILLSSIWMGGGSKEFGRFRWDGLEFRGDNLCWFQTEEHTRSYWCISIEKKLAGLRETGMGSGRKT